MSAVELAPAPKKPAFHPPYIEMISEAISALKERDGSSQIAISKFIKDKHKAHLTTNYKKLILGQLRKSAVSGKLTKVKNSYKLAVKPAVAKKTTAAKPKSVASKAKKVAVKRKPKPASVAAKKPKTVKKKLQQPRRLWQPKRKKSHCSSDSKLSLQEWT